MSVKQYVYAGVYLEMPLIKKIVETSYRIDSKGAKTDAIYDPYTGEKLKEIVSTKTETIYPDAYIDEDEDTLNKLGITEDDVDVFYTIEPDEDNIVVFGLNKKSKYVIPLNVSIECIDIQKLIKDFKKDYKTYLDYYKSIGYDITVKFGILTYYS